MSEKVFKSPRAVEEEIRKYGHQRFETMMQAVDRGEISKKLACRALREEFEYRLTLEGGEDE